MTSLCSTQPSIKSSCNLQLVGKLGYRRPTPIPPSHVARKGPIQLVPKSPRIYIYIHIYIYVYIYIYIYTYTYTYTEIYSTSSKGSTQSVCCFGLMVASRDPGGTSLPIEGKTSHRWEDVPYMGRLPICGKSSHIWQNFPYMGTLPIYGKTSHTWEDFQYMG